MNFNLISSQGKIQSFDLYISKFYFRLKKNQNCSKSLIHLKKFCKTELDILPINALLRLDFLCVNEAISFANSELYDAYAKDYSQKYNDTLRVVDNLQLSLKGKKDYYYPEFLFNGSFKAYDFDNCGLLIDPVREFIAERLDIYNQNRENDFIYTSPDQADALDDFSLIKKSIISKAEDLYLGKQFDYMEKCLQDRELRQVEPFLNYDKVKIKSLSDGGSLLAMARDGHLFLKDLNQPYDRPKLISRKELINANKDSPIFDHDNFELVDQNGKGVDKGLVDNFIKNIKYFKDEQLNLELTTDNRRGRP